MGGKKRAAEERIDPAPRLAMVLIRQSVGLFERQELAAALGVAPSLVSMWERGERPIPEEALEKAARLRNLSRPLLAQLLREIRSFLVVSQGKGRASRSRASAVAADLFPLLVDAMDLVLSVRSPARAPVEVEGLWRRLERRAPADRLLIVEEGEEYQTLALHERVLAESAARAMTEPREARELADLAARIAGLAGSPSARFLAAIPPG